MKLSTFSSLALCVFCCCCCSIPVVEAKRNYQHSKEEMLLTNQVVINARNCTPGETPIFVHAAAQTSGKYYDRRQVIRRTWAREAARYKMRVLFVIGVPESAAVQKQIEAESKQFNDILQFNFQENYFNITLKAVSLLKWSYRHCDQSKYMLKTDDDVIVNMPLLAHYVKSKQIPSGLTGMLWVTPSHRQLNHKWYMPPSVYTQDSYKFLMGFAYLLSMDQLGALLHAIDDYTGPVLDIDDVYITGIIADHGHVKQNNSIRFRDCTPDICTIETGLVINACSSVPSETEKIYRNWKRANKSVCHKKSEPGPI